MRRDYYIVLGIPADANLDQIKAAYRRRALELHPDVTKADSSRFRELQEAYETLSDSAQRADYDLQRSARAERGSPGRSNPGPHLSRKPPVIRPARFSKPPAQRLVVPHDGRRPLPLSSETDYGVLEVAVTGEEARRGGQIQLCLETPERCPACRGTGWRETRVCPACAGAGALLGQTEFTVAFPRRMPSPWSVRVPCSSRGLAWITVRFTIE